mgnify:CR=1 FL=1
MNIFCSSNPDDNATYPFVEEFCGTETDLEAFEMFENGITEKVQFGIQSFSFVDQPTAEIYMHCQVI